MREWLVAADDRTGAFEVAALFAQVVGPVTVSVGEVPAGSGVVDIDTRALSSAEAARIAAAIDDEPSTWIAHKIDSTLRGNWEAELAARQLATGKRVVVLPAWPEMGRTCVGGVVHVQGAPIGNVRARLAADLVADVEELGVWLNGHGKIVVCDVADSDAMLAAAHAVADRDVLVAGPAGPLGAVFAVRQRLDAPARIARESVQTEIGFPVVVVCGSAHPVAREQIRRLRVARPDVEVLATAPPEGALHQHAVGWLVGHARSRIEQLTPRTIVLIGGETAAAVLGDQPRAVSGFAAPGMPCMRTPDGPLVITKAGGFGGPDALVELLRSSENG